MSDKKISDSERLEAALAEYRANGLKAVLESPLCVATKTIRTGTGQTQRVSLRYSLFQEYKELENWHAPDPKANGENSDSELLDQILRAHLILAMRAHLDLAPGQSMKSLLAEWAV